MADVTIKEYLLGLRPYILIEIDGFDGDVNDPEAVDLGISFGGGIDLTLDEDRAGAAELLRFLADSLDEKGE